MRKMRELNTADRRKRLTLLLFVAVTLVLVGIWAVAVGVRVGFGRGKERTNPQQSGTARVYDYADMLTEAQEAALEERIAAAEQNIHADIVIVLINESLEEKYEDLVYLRSDETDAYTGIRRYAESFWTENGFGWNEAGNTGNGIIMVDNIYRESNGWVYNWVAGAGDMRFSVGNASCEKLSQAFTDRLPYGDMPHYDQTYADALLAFVDDCDTFGNKVRSILGWSLFSPASVFTAITSSLIMSIVVAVILCVLFGMMTWHLHYNGKQRRAGRRRGTVASGISGVLMVLGFILLCFISGGLAVLGMVIYVIVTATRDSAGTAKGEKKSGGKKQHTAPFAQRDVLLPDSYRVTDSKDTLVRHYVTSHTESDSGSGGGGFSGGGGSFGGGGGGGFSGGGSHR